MGLEMLYIRIVEARWQTASTLNITLIYKHISNQRKDKTSLLLKKWVKITPGIL